MTNSHNRLSRNRPAILRFVLLLSVIVTLPAGAQVDEFLRMHSEPGSLYSAKAMAMGNAYSTVGYDYTAVRFNPSTLAVVDSLSFIFGINYNVYPNSTYYQNTVTPLTTSNTALTQFGMTVPISSETRRTVFALGFAESKDLSRELKFAGYNSTSSTLVNDLTNADNPIARDLLLNYDVFDSTGRFLRTETILTGNLQQSGNVDQTGSVVTLSGAISTETAPNVFFGLSINYNIGTWKSEREFTETDINDVYGAGTQTIPSDARTDDFQSFYYHDIRDVLMKGFEVRIGLLYKFYDFISLGGSYKLSTPHAITESKMTEGTSQFASIRGSIIEPYESFSYSVKPAPELTFGAAVNLWILTATAEATFIDYTQVSYSDGPSRLETSLYNKRAAETYARVLNLNGGAELRLPFTGLSLRAGFMYRPSPYKSDTQDFARKYLSAGIGINSDAWISLDIAYGYGWWNEVYRGSGQTFSGVIQEIHVHDLMSTIKLTLP